MAQLDRTNPGPEFAPDGLLGSPCLVKAALNSFPPMEAGVTISQLIGSGAGSEERRSVLDWLCYTFEGMLVPTPSSAAIPQLSGKGSFLLLNTHARIHAAFQTALQDTGLNTGGIVAFHGTPPHNLFNIVCDGLNGNPAVFYSKEPEHSTWLISYRVKIDNPRICRGWSNSKFKNVTIMFGVEVAGSLPPDPPNEEDTIYQHALMVRYLFILPGEKFQGVASTRHSVPIEFQSYGGWVQGELITDRMREVYRKIHDGSLISEIEYGVTAESQRYSVRLSPLLRNPAVLDLLFTILYAELEVASTDQSAGSGRYPSGMSAADMMSTIDTFPLLQLLFCTWNTVHPALGTMYCKGRKHTRSYSSDSEAESPWKRRQARYPTPKGEALRKAKIIHLKRRKSCIPLSSDIPIYDPANTTIGEDAYQFVLPLAHLPELNHVALGISKTATAIVTCIYLQDNEYRACCSMEEQCDGQRIKASSNPDANFLTHLMTKQLHNELTYQETNLMRAPPERIRKFITRSAQEVNSSITTCCVQCKQPLKVTVARPTACSLECQKGYDKWPTQTKLSPLIREPHPKTLRERPSTLTNPPFPVGDMLDFVNSFPPMSPGITYERLVENGIGSSSYKRREVLKWLCSTFRGMIVPTPPSDKVTFNMPLPGHAEAAATSFLVLNTHQERQSIFEQQLNDHHNSKGGIAAFHGSPLHCVFNILCDGPNQNKISGGNVAKPATFYGADHETNSHQDTVMVRHLFLLPHAVEETYRDVYGHSYWIQDESVRAQMEETFHRIHDGRLIKDV
ncbi:hypothetical protein PG997_014246 [Apiospora hydei]|uniref:Uncharacterized protein n=1 Tax=Apiospora hydei TaxID=1337664 RepID=A0ABR1UWD5_9PEZI